MLLLPWNISHRWKKVKSGKEVGWILDKVHPDGMVRVKHVRDVKDIRCSPHLFIMSLGSTIAAQDRRNVDE